MALTSNNRPRRDMRDKGALFSAEYSKEMRSRQQRSEEKRIKGSMFDTTTKRNSWLDRGGVPGAKVETRVADDEQYAASEEAMVRWMEQNLAMADDGNGQLDPELLVCAANDQFNFFDKEDPTDEHSQEIHDKMYKVAEKVIADIGSSYVQAEANGATTDTAAVAVAGAYSAAGAVGAVQTRAVDEAQVETPQVEAKAQADAEAQADDELDPRQALVDLEREISRWTEENIDYIRRMVVADIGQTRMAIYRRSAVEQLPVWGELAAEYLDLPGKRTIEATQAVSDAVKQPLSKFVAFQITRSALASIPAAVLRTAVAEEPRSRRRDAGGDTYWGDGFRYPERFASRRSSRFERLLEEAEEEGEGQRTPPEVQTRAGSVAAPAQPSTDAQQQAGGATTENGNAATGKDNTDKADPSTIMAEYSQSVAQGLSTQIQGLNAEIEKQQAVVTTMNQGMSQLQNANDGFDHSAEIAALQGQIVAEQGKLDAMNVQLQGLMAQLTSSNAAATATGGTPAQVPMQAQQPAQVPPPGGPTPQPTQQPQGGTAPPASAPMGQNMAVPVNALRMMSALLEVKVQPFVSAYGVRAVTKDQVQPVIDGLAQLQQMVAQLLQNADAANTDNNNNNNNQQQQQQPQQQQGQNKAPAPQKRTPIEDGAVKALQSYFKKGEGQPNQGQRAAGNPLGQAVSDLSEVEIRQLIDDAMAGVSYRTSLVEECAAARTRVTGDGGAGDADYRQRIAAYTVEKLQSELAEHQKVARQIFSTGRRVVPVSAPVQGGAGTQANGGGGGNGDGLSSTPSATKQPSGGSAPVVKGAGRRSAQSNSLAVTLKEIQAKRKI